MKHVKLPKMTLAVVFLLMSVMVCAPFGVLAESAGEQKTLKFYFWDENQKGIMQAMADGFMAKNPNVTIECTVIPSSDYHTQLRISLPSGSGPDVFWINRTDLDMKDYIVPIQDDLAEAGIDLSNFVKSSVDLFTLDGELYGIPKDADAPLLFYNKAMFDAAGVPYPTNEWKWDDMRDAALKLTGDGLYGIGIHSGIYDGIYNYLPCNGAPVYSDDRTEFTANSPAGIEAMQYMLDMMYVDQCSPTQAEMTELSAENMFMGGITAMHLGGSWWLPPFYEIYGADLGVVMVPYNTERAYQSNSLAFARSVSSPHQAEAWEFQKYCASEEGQALQATFVIPALKGTADKWLENYSQIDASAQISALNYSIPMYFASKNLGECDEKLQEICNNIWMQSITPAEGLAQAEEYINALQQ